MRKEIKRYGSSSIILLSPEDLKLYELKVGDFIEIVITKIERKKKNEN